MVIESTLGFCFLFFFPAGDKHLFPFLYNNMTLHIMLKVNKLIPGATKTEWKAMFEHINPNMGLWFQCSVQGGNTLLECFSV